MLEKVLTLLRNLYREILIFILVHVHKTMYRHSRTRHLVYSFKTPVIINNVPYVVSTIGWDTIIGDGRTAETMIYDIQGQSVFFESLGMHPTKYQLAEHHFWTLEALRHGSLPLEIDRTLRRIK